MKTIARILLMLLAIVPIGAQTLGNNKIWHYQLTEGAAIMNDCPACDRVSIWEPLKGGFDLVGTAAATEFIVTNISFRTTGGVDRSVFGAGTLSYATGNPVLTLDVGIFLFDAGERVHMTNAVPEGPRIFPMIGAQANEDPGSITRVYRLRIEAAPIRELWFSTVVSMNSSNVGAVSHGDLLSSSGRIVKRNAELTERLSLPEGDVGLDAVDIGPRGEIFFSITTNVESVVNGPISHGDVVTSAGRVYLQSAQLLAPFGVDDPDAGLDALHIKADDEIYFSISKEIARAGASTLHRGDILSSKGRIVRTEASLLLNWNPGASPVGVDALYIWPNGEIWFSPEFDFTSGGGISVSAGDIISDQGYIAFRNSALTSPFNPTDAISDFGVDALTIISDTAANTASTQIMEFTPANGGFDLRWESAARVFQVERATAVQGPYFPFTELLLDLTAHDSGVGAASFYRVRQW